ncbi:hypothetical protein ACFV9G_09865 [Nocardioides sp. NPDC059952]|uniref:hypothetical protein n=1 Tax=Nocardioides sp. NPDC059952 TaxID=3347014 RepID=UPI0036668341
MSATDDPETTTADRPSRGRSIAAVICLVLAGLLMTPAAVAYWGQRTLNDAERYVETVGPLVESPEVQDVIATRVTAAIQKQVDVEAILNTAFAGVIADRPRLEQLVAPLAAAINGLVEREVRAFIASDEFADIWVRANTRAQQTLQRLLNGDDTGAVSLQGDEVVLDVDEVIEQVKARLVDRGLTIVENVPIPETDRQIVLMDAPQLKQVRTIYAFSNPVAQWLLPVVGVLFLAALVLARRRPRMAVWIGAVVAANALLLALVLSIGQQLFVNALAGTDFGPASRIFFDTLLSYLERGQQVVLWLGLVIVAAGWFAGSNRYGTTARTTIGGGLESLGSRLGDGPVGAAGRWVAANVGWVRVVVVALGGVVLLWGNNVSMNRLWWSLALVVALLVVLQVLVGAGRPRETSASLGSGPATGPEPGPAI